MVHASYIYGTRNCQATDSQCIAPEQPPANPLAPHNAVASTQPSPTSYPHLCLPYHAATRTRTLTRSHGTPAPPQQHISCAPSATLLISLSLCTNVAGAACRRRPCSSAHGPYYPLAQLPPLPPPLAPVAPACPVASQTECPSSNPPPGQRGSLA